MVDGLELGSLVDLMGFCFGDSLGYLMSFFWQMMGL